MTLRFFSAEILDLSSRWGYDNSMKFIISFCLVLSLMSAFLCFMILFLLLCGMVETRVRNFLLISSSAGLFPCCRYVVRWSSSAMKGLLVYFIQFLIVCTARSASPFRCRWFALLLRYRKSKIFAEATLISEIGHLKLPPTNHIDGQT